MNGPRGTFVIALLLLIAAELAFIGGALTGGGSLLAVVLFACSAVALIRVFVELFREGASRNRDAETGEWRATRGPRRPGEPTKRRQRHS